MAENGDALFLLEILHGLRRHLIGAVPLVHIADVFIMMRDLLELGLDPAGADAHDMDALRAQLAAERARQAQDIALARAVHRLIRHRLPGRVRAHVDDAAAGMHIRQARVAHASERERIELRAGEQLLAVRLGKGAEHAAAGRIDQHLDLGLLLLEQGLIGVDAAQIREIERDRTDGVRALVAQLLQPLFSAGNDPDLVIARVFVHSVDELPADTGGCAGDDSNVHTFSSKTKKSVVLSYRICSGCARDGYKKRAGSTNRFWESAQALNVTDWDGLRAILHAQRYRRAPLKASFCAIRIRKNPLKRIVSEDLGGRSVIIGFQKTQIYQRFAGSRQEVFILKIQNDENNAAQQDNGRRFVSPIIPAIPATYSFKPDEIYASTCRLF